MLQSWSRMSSSVKLQFCSKALQLNGCARSVVSGSATPWTVANQAPLSMGFPRQEYWSGLPLPPPGGLPDSGIKTVPPELAGGFSTLCHLGILLNEWDPHYQGESSFLAVSWSKMLLSMKYLHWQHLDLCVNHWVLQPRQVDTWPVDTNHHTRPCT